VADIDHADASGKVDQLVAVQVPYQGTFGFLHGYIRGFGQSCGECVFSSFESGKALGPGKEVVSCMDAMMTILGVNDKIDF